MRETNTPPSTSLSPSTLNPLHQQKLTSTVISRAHLRFTPTTSSQNDGVIMSYNSLTPPHWSGLHSTSSSRFRKHKVAPSQDPLKIAYSLLWGKMQNLYQWLVPTLACQLHFPSHFLFGIFFHWLTRDDPHTPRLTWSVSCVRLIPMGNSLHFLLRWVCL